MLYVSYRLLNQSLYEDYFTKPSKCVNAIRDEHLVPCLCSYEDENQLKKQ